VQASREAARRARCSSNLRQIGLALASYQAAHGSLPGGINGEVFSLHAMILPYLDQRPLYNTLNFSFPADLAESDPNSPLSTAFRTRIAVFLCPSETTPTMLWGGTNYAGNRGVGERIKRDSGLFTSHFDEPLRPADITDGLSSTAALSEWALGAFLINPGKPDRLGSVFEAGRGLNSLTDLEPFLARCRSLDTDRAPVNMADKGINWLQGGYRHTLYNHSLTPNLPSCVSGAMVQLGAYTAASRHPGGAHTLFADGHVLFQPATLDLAVWRAQGTRAGGEVVE
jgi:prepilin-type processing-associated H-X9-DG protein